MTATMVAPGQIYAFVLGTYALAALATRQTLPTGFLSALGFPAVIGLLFPVGLLQNGIFRLYSTSLASSQLAPRASIRRMTMLLAIVGADWRQGAVRQLPCDPRDRVSASRRAPHPDRHLDQRSAPCRPGLVLAASPGMASRHRNGDHAGDGGDRLDRLLDPGRFRRVHRGRTDNAWPTMPLV